MSEDKNITEEPYEIANRLLMYDKPKPLPQIIIDFIEQLFNLAFESGNVEAMNDLGAQYYDGSRGFEQDFSKAVECYKLAAEKGSRQAQENLGYCYYHGRNIPVYYEKAYHYFALGALDGHLISLYKIGDM
jgi:TPR repeat protein